MAHQNKPLETAGRTPSARLLESLGPTEQDLSTGSPFPITGKSLRLTYEITDTVQSRVPFLEVTVLDQRGKEVYSQVLFEEGVVRKVVRVGPGGFDLQAVAENLTYKLTIEDCAGREKRAPAIPPLPRVGCKLGLPGTS